MFRGLLYTEVMKKEPVYSLYYRNTEGEEEEQGIENCSAKAMTENSLTY